MCQTPTVTPGTFASRMTFRTAASSWRATAGVMSRTSGLPDGDGDGDGVGEGAANAAGTEAAAAPPASGTVSAPSASAIAAPLRSMADVGDMG